MRIIRPRNEGLSADMKRPRKRKSRSENPLDKVSEKQRRGPKRRMRPETVVGTAGTYNVQFSNVWERVGRQLLEAPSPEEVLNVLAQLGGLMSGTIDLKFATRVYTIVRDPKFPKARGKSQVRFLADSLGGELLTPRRSRDICAEYRAEMNRAHHILRYEFYIECSCGRKGHSIDHACPRCGAEIQFPEHLGSVFA